MKNVVLYIHGKDGNAEEAIHYKSLYQDSEVIGLDYTAKTPWEAKEEFPRLVDSICREYKSVTVIANSIGAFFTMNALADYPIEKAYFISPIVNMEKLIADMIMWAGVTEEELHEKGIIETEFANQMGATLTVMENGEHWFHTEEQMLFLDNWMRNYIR